MSYDLYFYKQKSDKLTETQIADYLTENLVPVSESGSQWFFENEDTEVYYSFDRNEPYKDEESIELYESFADFDNTSFSFNLNFMRPCFFGLEAFEFVEHLLEDLNLFVLDPQSGSETPHKPTKEELFNIWNHTNLQACAHHFEELNCVFMPIEKSNKVWEYNSSRKNLQEKLGDGYFVPKLFFFKTKKHNKAFTLTLWTEHIPMVIPDAEYFLLTRKFKKLFRKIEDTVLISKETLFQNFGSYFDSFDFEDCKIVHPENSLKVKDQFNSIKAEKVLDDFADRIPMENLYNARPNTQ